MSLHSSGILLFRLGEEGLRVQVQVLLVHPGGPFWSGKDEGAWSIPKGGFEEQESSLEAAKREFKEETGFGADGQFIDLGIIRQSSKKTVHGWALQSDLDTDQAKSNIITLEWPKNSGILREFPEIDKAQWFDVETARKKILKGQAGLIDRLLEAVNFDQMKIENRMERLHGKAGEKEAKVLEKNEEKEGMEP